MRSGDREGALDRADLTTSQPPDLTPPHASRSPGSLGEAAARAYLEKRGFRVAGANVQFGPKSGLKGELDLVAWTPDGATLAFVEVKTRRGSPLRVVPAHNVTPDKQRRIARLALAYAAREGLLDREDVSFRFDVVTVWLAPDDSGRVLRLAHLPGAFLAPEGFDDAG